MRKTILVLGARCPGGAYFWLADRPSDEEPLPPVYEPVTSIGLRDNEVAAALRTLTSWHLGDCNDGLFRGIVTVPTRSEATAFGPLNRWLSPENARPNDPTFVQIGDWFYCFPRTKMDVFELLRADWFSFAYPSDGNDVPVVWAGDDEFDMAVSGVTADIVSDVRAIAEETLRQPFLEVEPKEWMKEIVLDFALPAPAGKAPKDVAFRDPSGRVIVVDREQ